jgi:nucleoside-diphosphate-sugar epimerase
VIGEYASPYDPIPTQAPAAPDPYGSQAMADGTILITGASGFVGRAVLARLVESGREVRALTRSDDSARSLAAAGVEPVRGDIMDPASLAPAMAGCEVVYHVAGLNGFCLRS